LAGEEICDCGTKENPSPFCSEEAINGEACEDEGKKVKDGFYCRTALLWDYYSDGTPKKQYKVSICSGSCGDGKKTEGEECDDGNNKDKDGCDKTCHLEHNGWTCAENEEGTSICTHDCGDGIVAKDAESCDIGRDNTSPGCIDCIRQYGYTCNDGVDGSCYCDHGDGILCAEEECDVGPSYKGCDHDGKVVEGWECFTITGDDVGKTSLCIPEGCGNGYLNTGEECDDGNNDDNDGCSHDCKLEVDTFQCDDKCKWTEDKLPCYLANYTDLKVSMTCHRRVCGDGYRTDNEGCDDGNTKDGDGCSSTCEVEPFYKCKESQYEVDGKRSYCEPVKVCGDGFRHPDEECDNLLVGSGGCNASCFIEPGYVCETNNEGRSECHKPICGNGIREGDEECDDGNTNDGDGCSHLCRREAGFRCYVPSKGGHSICTSSCGDGMKTAAEECDDGNLVSGDGCSPSCKIEHGYTCVVDYNEPECAKGSCLSICYATCGDGIVAQEEECDDGNDFAGDGCNSTCQIESGDWRCRGEPSECILRKCELAEPVVHITHVLCPGSLTGVIDIDPYTDTADEVVTKVWKSDTMEPNSYKSAIHFANLAAGTYTVKVAVVGFTECTQSKTVTINQPKAFSGLSVTLGTHFDYNQQCSNTDGWIKWEPSGGTPPYSFYFANRSVSETGNYEHIDISEFNAGPPTLVDSNNCTRTMVVKEDQWPDGSKCETGSVPYLMEGSIGLAAAFVVAIVAGVIYSCWSSKRQVPKGFKPNKSG